MRRITKYELAAFITGFSLLAYELAAARILAPSIGSSTYVWTSVIGVIIAALSLGYAVGGMLADKRVKQSDISWLLLLAAGTVITTYALSDTVLSWVTNGIKDPRLQGLLVATLLFTPTSFILGIISPYLARLRTVSLETTGTSVAFLSAANAIGGIIGTFSVGFIFFGYIGSKETFMITALFLVLSSLFFAPYRQIIKRGGIGLFIVLFIFLWFPQSSAEAEVADIDTASARYKIYDVAYDNAPTRLLVSGPNAAQSGVRLDGSNELVFFYTRQMAALVDTAPKKDRILILGGGAFTMPRYFAEKYPDSQIDVAEIDPKLPGIAKQYFNYSNPGNVHIYGEDARAYLNTNKIKYDIILVDVYSDSSIPFSVATQEYTERLKQSLQPQGLVISNVIGSDTQACRPQLRAIHASYAHSFLSYRLYPDHDLSLQTKQNLIFAYSNQALSDRSGLVYDLSGGMDLTDNFAPLERLKLECQKSEI